MNTHDRLTTDVCLGSTLILAACGGETEVAEDTAEPAQQPSSAGFVIENVPPGTYTLEVWHETVGSSSQTLTVTEGQAANVSLELSQD